MWKLSLEWIIEDDLAKQIINSTELERASLIPKIIGSFVNNNEIKTNIGLSPVGKSNSVQ